MTMPSAQASKTASKKAIWTGRAFDDLALAFLIFDDIIKLIPIAPVNESSHARLFGLARLSR